MALTVTKYSGSMTGIGNDPDSTTIYTCPAGRLAKVVFPTWSGEAVGPNRIYTTNSNPGTSSLSMNGSEFWSATFSAVDSAYLSAQTAYCVAGETIIATASRDSIFLAWDFIVFEEAI